MIPSWSDESDPILSFLSDLFYCFPDPAIQFFRYLYLIILFLSFFPESQSILWRMPSLSTFPDAGNRTAVTYSITQAMNPPLTSAATESPWNIQDSPASPGQGFGSAFADIIHHWKHPIFFLLYALHYGAHAVILLYYRFRTWTIGIFYIYFLYVAEA